MQLNSYITIFVLLISSFSTISHAQQTPMKSLSVDKISAIAFTPNSQKIVFNTINEKSGRVAKVYDLSTQKVLFEFAKHSNAIFDIDISPDGQWVATGGLGDGSVQGFNNKAYVWNINTGEVKCEITMPLNPNTEYPEVNGINGLDFSDDGKLLLVGTGSRAGTWLWDVNECVPIFKSGKSPVFGRNFQLFPGSTKALIRASIISIPEGKQISTIPDNVARILSANVVRVITAGNLDNAFRVLEINVETKERKEFPIIFTKSFDLALSPNGRFVVIGNYNNEPGQIRVLNVETGEPVREFVTPTATEVRKIVFDKSMSRFAAIQEEGVHIFDMGELTSQVSDAQVLDN